MKDVVVPRNTRGSIMEEPLWCNPNAKRNPNNTPEENARIDALLKRLDEDCKDWHVGRSKDQKI